MIAQRIQRFSIGVLLRPAETDLGAEVRARLEDLGHAVELASSGESLLAEAPFDVVASDADVPGQWSGLGLAEALVAAGYPTRFVLVGGLPDHATFRRALRLGVRDHVPRPFAPEDLVSSLLAAAGPAPAPHDAFARAYALDPGAAEEAALELSAFLLLRRVPPSHRVRAATAVAGLVRDLEAGAGSARLFLGARLDGTTLGVDLEARRLPDAATDLVAPALPRADASGGDTRLAQSLCDGVRIHHRTQGTLVRLAFDLAPVRFDEEDEDLAELDFLDLDAARPWLARLRRHDGRAIPPALTTTVGRLLATEESGADAVTAPRSAEPS